MLCLFHLFIGWTWLLLCQHQYLEGEIGNPLLAELQTGVEVAQANHGLQYAGIREIVLVEDVVHGLCSELIEGLLHEAWQTELELHQVAHEHHQILGEVLELDEIGIDILELLAVLADAGINLLEKVIVGIIEVLHHLLDLSLFTDAQTVVDGRNMEAGLEDTRRTGK